MDITRKCVTFSLYYFICNLTLLVLARADTFFVCVNLEMYNFLLYHNSEEIVKKGDVVDEFILPFIN